MGAGAGPGWAESLGAAALGPPGLHRKICVDWAVDWAGTRRWEDLRDAGGAEEGHRRQLPTPLASAPSSLFHLETDSRRPTWR